MKLHIRKALAGDLDRLWPLVRRAVAKMNAGGSDQWGEDYPTRGDYAADIAAGDLYAAEDESGALLGVACVNTCLDPTYAGVPWTLPGPAMSVHRMAVDPAVQRRGVASALVQFAEELARERGLGSMRVDTYSKNTGMQALFLGRGYVRRGEIRLHSRALVFPAFEKAL